MRSHNNCLTHVEQIERFQEIEKLTGAVDAGAILFLPLALLHHSNLLLHPNPHSLQS
jgi:hypothetical protein